MVFTITELPYQVIDDSYNDLNVFLEATEGTQPHEWSLISGSLPTGLNLGIDGLISGIPTVVEKQIFTVQVMDAAGSSDTQELSITIIPRPVIGVAVATSGAGGTSGLDGTVGVAYSVSQQASDGTPPYVSWEILHGVLLPAGPSLNSSTGEISGTPETIGEQIFQELTFTLHVTDSLGATGDAEVTIRINARPTITTTILPDGYVGVTYPGFQLETTGGTGGAQLRSNQGQNTRRPEHGPDRLFLRYSYQVHQG